MAIFVFTHIPCYSQILSGSLVIILRTESEIIVGSDGRGVGTGLLDFNSPICKINELDSLTLFAQTGEAVIDSFDVLAIAESSHALGKNLTASFQIFDSTINKRLLEIAQLKSVSATAYFRSHLANKQPIHAAFMGAQNNTLTFIVAAYCVAVDTFGNISTYSKVVRRPSDTENDGSYITIGNDTLTKLILSKNPDIFRTLGPSKAIEKLVSAESIYSPDKVSDTVYIAWLNGSGIRWIGNPPPCIKPHRKSIEGKY